MYREITNLTLKLLFFKKRKLKNSSLMRIFINFLLCLKLNDFEIDEWKMKNFKLLSIKILEQKSLERKKIYINNIFVRYIGGISFRIMMIYFYYCPSLLFD